MGLTRGPDGAISLTTLKHYCDFLDPRESPIQRNRAEQVDLLHHCGTVYFCDLRYVPISVCRTRNKFVKDDDLHLGNNRSEVGDVLDESTSLVPRTICALTVVIREMTLHGFLKIEIPFVQQVMQSSLDTRHFPILSVLQNLQNSILVLGANAWLWLVLELLRSLPSTVNSMLSSPMVNCTTTLFSLTVMIIKRNVDYN